MQTLEQAQAVFKRIVPRGTFQGVVEGAGVQRSGKSTLQTDDYLSRVLAQWPERPTLSNYYIDAPKGTHIVFVKNEELHERVLWLRDKEYRDWCVLVDEAGQIWPARGYADKKQTELASFLWQAPKRGHLFYYTANVGNSVDKIIRLATQITVIPAYLNPTGVRGDAGFDPSQGFIRYSVIDNHHCQFVTGRERHGIYERAQTRFDTLQPIS